MKLTKDSSSFPDSFRTITTGSVCTPLMLTWTPGKSVAQRVKLSIHVHVLWVTLTQTLSIIYCKLYDCVVGVPLYVQCIRLQRYIIYLKIDNIDISKLCWIHFRNVVLYILVCDSLSSTSFKLKLKPLIVIDAWFCTSVCRGNPHPWS